jgi:hypothetical protein
LSGQQTTLLSNQDRDSLRVDLRGEWRAFAARADGTAARYRDTNLKYDELRFGQQVTYRPSYYWQVGLIASQSDTEFLETSRESQMRDIRFTAAWTTEHGLWADAFISHRTLHDSELPAETVTEGVVKVRRRWPKLDVAVSLGMGERTRGGVQTQYSDVHLTAVRQF